MLHIIGSGTVASIDKSETSRMHIVTSRECLSEVRKAKVSALAPSV